MNGDAMDNASDTLGHSRGQINKVFIIEQGTSWNATELHEHWTDLLICFGHRAILAGPCIPCKIGLKMKASLLE